MQTVPPEKKDVFLQRLVQFVEEQGDQESRIERLTADSARRQFFKAIYDRDYHLVKLLLTGSRRKYVHANLICPEDRWTALHACLYKYNQYPPEDTLRIVRLLLDHSSDVNQPCPDGAVAINVLDKKPLPNGQQNGPDNPNREKKTVSFQNKMVLDVAIDFLQAYKWAGCRPSVLANWKPLIELLDEASMSQKNQQQKEFNSKFVVKSPPTTEVNAGYQKKFKMLFENQIGCDCTVVVIEQSKDDVIFPVHRAILMSSSPVFQAMFENDMQEKKNSEVRIEDIPSDAVKLMLDYIYGGVLPTNTFLPQSSASSASVSQIQSSALSLSAPSSVSAMAGLGGSNLNNNNNSSSHHDLYGDEQKSSSPIVSSSNYNNSLMHSMSMNNANNNNNNNLSSLSNASQSNLSSNNMDNKGQTALHLLSVGCALLCLSDKYRMNDLKHHCEYALHQLLNLDSCLDLLLASNHYNARRLRSVSLNYVSAHFQTLSQSSRFKEFGDRNPSLLQEVLSNVTKEVQARPQKRLRLAMSNNAPQNNANNPHKF